MEKGILMTFNPIKSRRRLRATLATVGATAALLLTALPASANTIDVDYDVNGSTHIGSTGSNITLGPAVMHSFVNADGTFRGEMTLPGTRTTFDLLGFIPVTADVNFEPVGDGATTGEIVRTPDRRQELHSTTQYYVRLSNIKASIFPLFAGPNCRTSNPVTINANTPAGESFQVASGGNLVGEYSIGDFQDCGLNTWLINQIIPGGGNTVELHLTDGRLAG